MDNYVKQTDEQLVRDYEKGDFHAFDILLERYQNKVFGYIRCMIPDTEIANDVFQDTFVKIIMAIRNGHYTETGQFSSWIMRVARNQVLDSFRSLRTTSHNVISHEVLDGEGDMVADLFNNSELCEPNIEMQMLVEQSHEDVRMMIERLPEPQREVVYMRYYLMIQDKRKIPTAGDPYKLIFQIFFIQLTPKEWMKILTLKMPLKLQSLMI